MTCNRNAISAEPTRTRSVCDGRLSMLAGQRLLAFLAADFDEGDWRRMPLRLGTPASVMEYLLPLSGPDPETVLTPGSFSTSRSQRHWRARLGAFLITDTMKVPG